MALLLTFSLLSLKVSINWLAISISANSLSMMVEWRISRPTTEQTRILIMGDLICSSIFFKSAIKTLFINELDTFEFTMIDSKYCKVLIFSLMVVLLAMDVYTSLKWLSI